MSAAAFNRSQALSPFDVTLQSCRIVLLRQSILCTLCSSPKLKSLKSCCKCVVSDRPLTGASIPSPLGHFS
ncbi:hypothetical protein ECG_08739 [Echinococcus granulosus]|nr:hypothetical protein ECG_08739 [Echinococcus granulosus]